MFQLRCDERLAGEGSGNIRNVTLADITYRGSGELASLLKGVDAAHTVDGVYFYNYSRQGITVTNATSGNISSTDYVTNIYYYAINTAPNAALASPAPLTTFLAPASVNIQADVSDSDGQVARVDFYSNGQQIGNADASPWTFNWNGVPAGTYDLAAVAVDNAGGSSTSTMARVTVLQPLTFVSWAASYGVPTSGGGTNDSDHDGYSDLLEYVSGSNPTNASSGAALDGQFIRSNSTFNVQFNHNPAATDITVNVEFSPSLLTNTWQCIKSNVFGTGWIGVAPCFALPSESGIETVVVGATNADMHTGFIRLRIIK
jgi:hypothetical protein